MNEEKIADCGSMIQEMLGLDPGMLGVMSPADGVGNDRALLGFGALIRRSLELTIQLRERKNLTLRLKSTDEQARAWGFGDKASADLGMLFVWGFIRAYRHCRGFHYAPLMAADEKVVDLPPRAESGVSAMSVAQLVDKVYDDKPYPEPKVFDYATPDDIGDASIVQLTRDVLGVHGMDLAQILYDTKNDMVPDLVSHPEDVAGNGLIWFLQAMATQYLVMKRRDGRKIQLRTQQDAVDAEIPGGAKAANLMTLMAASLFADKQHRLVFLEPTERSFEEIHLLNNTARWVYLNFNTQVFDGLTLLYEGNRHFGTTGRFNMAARLLHSIRLEVDPDLKRMPVLVRAIEAGLGRPSQHYRWQQAS